jgi:aminoglycoside phosphotransferase (APT) family kinase protein
MGRALASLSQIEWDSIDLPILDAVTFGQLHAQRIGELAGHLDPLRDVIADWDQLCSAQTPGGGGRLVLTHGDPGPGNYLDDGDGGTLIDWEESHVAPMGLDLARAVFIALLGVGPAGYVGRDHQQRARAVTRGYLDRIYDEWLPTPEESRWWLAVAGVQFIHRRWERAGRGGVPPWQEALLTLKNALGSRQPY